MTVSSTRQADVRRYRVMDRGGVPIDFDGVRLGHGSSHAEGRPRWFEVEIYRRQDNDDFIVVTRGKSNLDGETTRTRVVQTPSAFEVISLLTVHHGGKTYIPRQSDRALAQAAQWDDDIRDAYINRAVT
jgi:hypothetical protein